MNSSWDFDSNFKDIVRFVDTLDEDTSPVTDSNGSSVTINQTIGFEENQSAYRNSAVERLYPYYIGNVSAFKAQQDGDRNRECLDKQANVFIRSNPKEKMCQFCKNNGEPTHVYASHPMKDKRGRVVCLKLRSFKCPICGATGDDAHTKKYCSHKPLKS